MGKGYLLNIGEEDKRKLAYDLLEQIKKERPKKRWELKPESRTAEGHDATYTHLLDKNSQTRYYINKVTRGFLKTRRECAANIGFPDYPGHFSLLSIYDDSLSGIVENVITSTIAESGRKEC